MRLRQPLISAVLTLALLLGQWLAATHGSDHALQPNGSDNCAVCVYAHSAGAGALPTVPVVALAAPAEAPTTDIATRPHAAAIRHHPIRGPPALLA
jgi:hypothetical protein